MSECNDRNICALPCRMISGKIYASKRINTMVLAVANVSTPASRIIVNARLDEKPSPGIACHTFRKLQLADSERGDLETERRQKKTEWLISRCWGSKEAA
jgi:hypothetical protein